MHPGSAAFHIYPVSARIAAKVALMSACGTAALLGACKGDEARLSVAVQPMSSPMNTAEVRYRIDVGDRRWQFTLPATPSPGGGRRTSGEFETPRSGTARVAFTVVLADGRDVAAGDASVVLRGDWAWGFDLIAATADPRGMCFGCAG